MSMHASDISWISTDQMHANFKWCHKVSPYFDSYLTIIPRARMGSESIAHEAEG